MPLDPQCQALIDAVEANGSPFAENDVSAIRNAYLVGTALFKHEPANAVKAEDTNLEGPASKIPIRVYRPLDAATTRLPCLIYFHGGGWAVGNLDSHDHLCRYLSSGTQCVVIAVDYRLAPEHPFPAALDDCIASINWVAGNAEALNIDPTRIALGGDSAGGNLAASSAIQLRDNGGPAISLQLLIYPAVDFTADNASLKDCATGYILTRKDLDMFIELYLSNEASRSDPRASPQLRNQHAGLPPAFIQTAEFDPLRDEGREYAETLVKSGVAVDYKCYPGMVHGFARMGAKVDMALTALDDACGALREAFR